MSAAGAPAARVWEEDLEVLDPHYGVDDVPPPLETVLYAWQHTLVDVSPYVLPLVVARAVGYSDAQAAYMISACLVLMGIFTYVNTTFGHRLPSVMGPSATNTGAMASVGAIFGAPAMWTGAFFGGIFEAVVGASGLLGRLRRYLPPYVCGIVVTTIGLSLARVAGGWVFADTRPAMLGLVAATAASVVLLAVARSSSACCSSASRARRSAVWPTSVPSAKRTGSACRARSPLAARVWAGPSLSAPSSASWWASSAPSPSRSATTPAPAPSRG